MVPWVLLSLVLYQYRMVQYQYHMVQYQYQVGVLASNSGMRWD